MATWGYGNFDNDSALDWLMDFAEEPKLSKIQAAFVMVTDSNELPDALDCEEALVAAEVIAFLLDKGSSDFPEEELASVKNCGIQITSDLKNEALATIKRIMMHSELKDLWEESEEIIQWHEVVKELETRLLSTIL